MPEISCREGREHSSFCRFKKIFAYAKTAVLKEELLEFGLDLKVRDREGDCLQKKKNPNCTSSYALCRNRQLVIGQCSAALFPPLLDIA